jgi:hypothetical protein
MTRLRTNLAFGTLLASITNTATALTSGGFTGLPVVTAPDILAITLNPGKDPAFASGASEVVWLTAHASTNASATGLRGQEGTAGTAFPVNTPWVHAPTQMDFSDFLGRLGEIDPARDFGAKGDCVKMLGSMTSGANLFTRASSVYPTVPFTSADVGKLIEVQGAGAAGVSLTTTIASIVDTDNVRLAANASTTVTGVATRYGTDDSVAIQSAINLANSGLGTRVVRLNEKAYFANIVMKPYVTLVGRATVQDRYGPTDSDFSATEIHSAPGSTTAIISDGGVFCSPHTLKDIRISGDYNPSGAAGYLSPNVPAVRGIEYTASGGSSGSFYWENVTVEQINHEGISTTRRYAANLYVNLLVKGTKWTGHQHHGVDSLFLVCNWGGNVWDSSRGYEAGIQVYGSTNQFHGGGAWYNGLGPGVSSGFADGIAFVNLGVAGENGSGCVVDGFAANDNSRFDYCLASVYSTRIKGTSGGASSGAVFIENIGHGASQYNDVELEIRGSDRQMTKCGVTFAGTVTQNSVRLFVDADPADDFGVAPLDSTYQHVVLLSGALMDTNLVEINGQLCRRTTGGSLGTGTWNPPWTTGDLKIKTLTGNVTVGPTTTAVGTQAPPGAELVMVFTQDATGGRTVTWDASYLNPPPVNPAANAVTVAHFINVSQTNTPTWRCLTVAPFVSSCKVHNSAAISVPNTTTTLLAFDTEDWDNNNIHSTSSNPSRLVAPVTGKYLVTLNCAWTGVTGGALREAQINLNSGGTGGGTVLASDGKGPSTAQIRHSVAVQVALSAGDYVEAYVYQDSGSTMSIGTGVVTPTFSMTKIAD